MILNKALSLVVVAAALPFRTAAVPLAAVLTRWDVIANLLGGSLAGAWAGAAWATRLRSRTLYRVIAVLLIAIAGVLLLGHGARDPGPTAGLAGSGRHAAGLAAGSLAGAMAGGRLVGAVPDVLLLPLLALILVVSAAKVWQHAPPAGA